LNTLHTQLEHIGTPVKRSAAVLELPYVPGKGCLKVKKSLHHHSNSKTKS